ncbi:MAG: hypothetical protein J5563_03845 [Clostridia bacterium]|nr:hypothetical protein [Clostridia bacterium]
MKLFRFLALLPVLTLCLGTFTLTAAPRTLDEISGLQSEEAKKELEAKRQQEEANEKLENAQSAKRKRMIIATTTLVTGAVLAGLGGLSFYEMSESKKWHDKYQNAYYNTTFPEEAEKYRKKAGNADDDRKMFLSLGAAGVALGAALITTGIVFYSIKFEDEKEVKKTEISFGANPLDSSIYLTLNW